MLCFDCPRACGVDREKSLGYCKEGKDIKVAKIIPNFKWEEPCISGQNGALAIFFSGCNLRCSFCQNYDISHISKGTQYSPKEFRKLLESYDLTKFSSIDLITPTHFSSALIESLQNFKCPIPIVWNSSGYESKEMIKKVAKIVDVFMPDFKYFSSQISQELSACPNYFEVAIEAIKEMKKQKSNNIYENDILKEGVIIRHLVLPGHTSDSIKIMDAIKENIDNPLISLMSQFIPLYNSPIKRKLYPLEYKIVLNHALKIGLNKGFIQDYSSADENFVPDF